MSDHIQSRDVQSLNLAGSTAASTNHILEELRHEDWQQTFHQDDDLAMIGGDGPAPGDAAYNQRKRAYIADCQTATNANTQMNEVMRLLPRIFDFRATGGGRDAGAGTINDRLTALMTGLGATAERQQTINQQFTQLVRLVEGGQVPRRNLVALVDSLARIQERVTAGVPAAERAGLVNTVEAMIRAAHHPILDIRAGVSAEQSMAISEGLSTIPRPMLEALQRAGYRVTGVRSYSEIVAGAGTRQATPGRTWDQAYSGIFWPAENQVVIRQGTDRNWTIGTARHEVGHAIDYLLGGGGTYHSQGAAFREVYTAERDEINRLIALHTRDVADGRANPRGLNPTQAAALAYYLNSPTETWAEIFCVLHGGTPGLELNELIRTHFPRSLRLVQEALNGRFPPPRR